MIDGFADIEQVHPAHHLADGAEPKSGHDLSKIVGDKIHQIDQIFGPAGKFFAQFRILGGDSHRTGIEMTDPHHGAAQGHHTNRSETEFFGPQQAGDGDITGRFELTVAFQHHPAAQAVHDQGLLGFGQAQFPG